MKKIAFLFFVAFGLFMASCGNNEQPANNSQPASNAAPVAPVDNSPYAAGKGVYQRTCIVCHQPDGTGMEGTYPPLAKSDYLLADKYRAIHQVLKGSSYPITVNTKTYNGVMPSQKNLTDDDVAAVLNYVTHSFDNNGYFVTAAEVKAVRDTIK